ncbi:Tetratricopeptide repeat protein 7B [Lamellibrachia satsuma]|nr:Tetratricopeptide repeat protein 7B [Lamellibrachia satsuma]
MFERYLLENHPSEKNITKPSSELAESRKKLDSILHSDIKLDLKQDAQILMAKLFYVVGDYSTTLARLEALHLDKINIESSSNRKMRLIGEAYAIKGLCLEKLPPLTNTNDTETRDRQILHCFEMAGDICLLQLQDRQDRFFKTPSQSSVTNVSPSGSIWCSSDGDCAAVGPFVENAIQRSPILYIRNGEISKGVGRFRDLLQAVEVRGLHGLRQLLARELAEVLLRGMCDATYSPIRVNAKPNSVSPTRKLKPKKYTGDGLFVPKNRDEEVLLLLLISESIAARDVVLNRSQEHTQVRQHTLRTTVSIYDLLTIVLVRYEQFGMLSETFERAMRFSFEEFHIWYQFGLSLMCSQKYSQAVLVFKECMRLEPGNAVVPLLIAKVCYEHLHMWDEGIEAAAQAMKCECDRQLLAKSYVMHGVGYCLKAEDTHLETSRREFHSKALKFFLKAVSLDSSDHLSLFYVALLLALLRQIPEALKYVKKALCLRSDHLQSLQLLALLLTANKSYTQAYDLIVTAIAEYPDHFR